MAASLRPSRRLDDRKTPRSSWDGIATSAFGELAMTEKSLPDARSRFDHATNTPSEYSGSARFI
ncbi:MAG: hypothetical protein ABI387_13335 [Lacunisphaera sp.]